MRVLALILALGAAVALQGAEPKAVVIEPSKTSIYVGSVTLTSSPLDRSATGYSGKYTAKVFPYFFQSEKGEVTIAATAGEIARLLAGTPVDFTGSARASNGDERRIEGRATPTSPGAGKIKIRIFVSKRIELIFNTTYQLR